MIRTFLVTTGDKDGIGLEVASKALNRISSNRKTGFVLFRSSKASTPAMKSLNRKFYIVSAKSTNYSLAELIPILRNSIATNGPTIIDYESDGLPPHWVVESTQECINGLYQGLITGPMSKPLIAKSGLSDIGHTDILKRVSGTKNVYMTFLGKKFNVILATGHIPLREVSIKFSLENLKIVLNLVNNFRQNLSSKNHKFRMPIGILGLNPHSGDLGLIGKEELYIFQKVKDWCKDKKIPAIGPLVPDAAFLHDNQRKFSFFVACYHDQGLIPFKMAHEHAGTQYSLGLPFIRTSVDHGTAKDIYGMNCANEQSMYESIQWCLKLSDAQFRAKKKRGQKI